MTCEEGESQSETARKAGGEDKKREKTIKFERRVSKRKI